MITNFIASFYHDANIALESGIWQVWTLSLNFDLASDNNIRLISLFDTNLSIAVDRVLVIATNKQLDVLQNRFPHFIRQLGQVHF